MPFKTCTRYSVFTRHMCFLLGATKAAEEEYRSGFNKLRAARHEMQRLSMSVDKDERAANGEV